MKPKIYEGILASFRWSRRADYNGPITIDGLDKVDPCAWAAMVGAAPGAIAAATIRAPADVRIFILSPEITLVGLLAIKHLPSSPFFGEIQFVHSRFYERLKKGVAEVRLQPT